MTTDKKTDTQIFSRLDKAFWMAWGALPFLAGLRIYFLYTSAYFNAGGIAGGEKAIIEFSPMGQILATSFLCINLILYIALLAYMHTLTRQFQRGSLFVENTLKYMKRIAILMIAWPFVKVISFNLASHALVRLGDVHEWKLQFDLDLALISAGLVILALRLVMSHAIKLHHDAQYTV